MQDPHCSDVCMYNVSFIIDKTEISNFVRGERQSYYLFQLLFTLLANNYVKHFVQKKEKGMSLRCFYTVPDSLCHCHLATCQDHAMAHATVPARESFCTSEDHTSQPHSTTTLVGMGSPIHTVDQDTTCHQNVCGYPMLTTDLCQGRHGGMPY